MNLQDAIQRLRSAARDFAEAEQVDPLLDVISARDELEEAALEFASAKRSRRNARDHWKSKHRELKK